jgi:hypothetical protein
VIFERRITMVEVQQQSEDEMVIKQVAAYKIRLQNSPKREAVALSNMASLIWLLIGRSSP